MIGREGSKAGGRARRAELGTGARVDKHGGAKRTEITQAKERQNGKGGRRDSSNSPR